MKIEEQKRKREQVLLWKELRRKENLKQIETQEIPSSNQEQKIRPVQQRLARDRVSICIIAIYSRKITTLYLNLILEVLKH